MSHGKGYSYINPHFVAAFFRTFARGGAIASGSRWRRGGGGMRSRFLSCFVF
ncbi:hypothetical protein [Arthrospira platensis]|uniref:hypothetical protein n=1 Tax=Limnospira TaxID=2596745 RepID=UPI00168211ED|nr:hypothetical protein [Arthrospira platensis]